MTKSKWIPVLVLAILLALGAGVFLAVTHLTYYGGHFYPKQAQAMDLRGEALTVSDFDALSEKLPQCYILWSIPFQGGSISSDLQNLKVNTLTDEDVDLLDYATNLQTVDGTNCTDYPQLMTLQERHPSAKVLYQMTISGTTWDQDTQSLNLTGFSEGEVPLLHYLPKLTEVNISGCQDYSLLLRLREENPQWNLSYTVALGSETFPWDTETLQLQDVTCEQLTQALAALPKLRRLDVVNPQGDCQTLPALRDSYPDVEIHWQVELYGQTLTDETTQLDISGIQVASCEEVEQAVACLPNLETLIMSDCGIENEDMAAFRERQRDNYKVVWTVYLGTRPALGNKRILRTDATRLWANCYYYDDELVNLKYCEDMIALDLGHTGVKNIDFVSYMPHLTYFIVADSNVQDLTPISSCKELIWLELGWCNIKSYEPLLGCTAMEDLNIGRTYADPTPISQMTWLKNLWCMDTRLSSRQLWQETLTDTTIQSAGSDVVAYGWRKLPNYYKMRDALGAYPMD